MIQHYVNHVIFVIDRSGSMNYKPVVKVFDTLLNRLKEQSVAMDQETRVSIYLFDDKITCLTFDMDVMRFKTLEGHYVLGGSTALINATMTGVTEHMAVSTQYGDHAFLLYVLTDGGENCGGVPSALKTVLDRLPENWTVACQVPDLTCKAASVSMGFPKDAVELWNTAAATGLAEAVTRTTTAIDTYMTNRAKGVRGSKSFFSLDPTGLTVTAVKKALKELNPASYMILRQPSKDVAIKEYVESWTKAPYVLGSAYYTPTKKVKIQDHKHLLIRRRKDGHTFEGDAVRQLLGLPDHTVDVDPTDHKDWQIFVQSTSVNRKLLKDETWTLVRL